MATEKHKVFVSFHSADIGYKKEFERLFHNTYEVIISYSVQENDISANISTDTVRKKIRDEYLRDSTVTVILIGKETWQRKHVDWEISSSLRHTEFNPRSGLLGIFLPTHTAYLSRTYDPHTIPPRLAANAKLGYAALIDWTTDPQLIQSFIHQAFLKKDVVIPDNSYPNFANNRTGDRWS